MKTRGNEITIFRGEEFTIDKEIVNPDGTPFIVGEAFVNPCWLISITDSLYQQNGRVTRNYWLPIELFRPDYNRVFHLSELCYNPDGTPGDGQPAYRSFDDITAFPLTGYWNGQFVSIPAAWCVFECDGKYRYYFDVDDWYKYSCNIVNTFTSSDTRTWKPQDYIYTIQLVAGEKMLSHLIHLCNERGILPSGSKETLYNKLIESGYVFPEDFDLNNYLYSIDGAYPILSPTRLTVVEYAQGGIYD